MREAERSPAPARRPPPRELRLQPVRGLRAAAVSAAQQGPVTAHSSLNEDWTKIEQRTKIALKDLLGRLGAVRGALEPGEAQADEGDRGGEEEAE